MHIIRFYSIRQTRQTCFEACILYQSKVIAKKLLVTYDDVTRPPLLIAEVSGAPVNLTRAPLGYSAERTPLGGVDSAPLSIFRTEGRRETGKAANERAQQGRS